MSSIRKYAGLPDLDAAPDIYETPDLTDDTSTYPASTTVRSASPSSVGEENEGIDRHRLNQDEARSHFIPKNERDILSSSRISEKRKPRRQLVEKPFKEGEDIINSVDADASDEEESLERRLARLRKEIAEVKEEVERHNTDSKGAASAGEAARAHEVESLSQMLAALNPLAAKADRSADRLGRRMKSLLSAAEGSKVEEKSVHTGPSEYIGINEDSSTAIADFDTRLASLESALGLESISLPAQDHGMPKAVIPTLEVLEKQISVMSNTSDLSLDRLKGRIRELAQDAESLNAKRSQTRSVTSSGTRNGSTLGTNAMQGYGARKDATDDLDDLDQAAKINALYGTLGTIESLAPLLPSTLERMRSLRELHAGAAEASQTLSRVETQQHEMQLELKSWKEGLEKVEAAMQQSGDALESNAKVVEAWVEDLEERMKKLK